MPNEMIYPMSLKDLQISTLFSKKIRTMILFAFVHKRL